MSYCIYLRKSRADVELEKEGKYETLSRHKSILLKFAAEKGLQIAKIREEIASGESIVNRPEMLLLLREVGEKKYRGVLVMDIDRLGRGNMREQGLILETFKSAETLIITPQKTYDLENEFDEEYSEFSAFMARKELKLINRRLQQGRLKSIEDGNYIAPLPPYGYDIYKDGKKRRLIPNPEQAPVVKIIFGLYAHEGIGAKRIAARLNEMGVKTYTGKSWDGNSVLTIIKNRVYTGTLEWKKKTYRKSPESGRRIITVNDESSRIIIDNAHEPIVDSSLFEKAWATLKSGRSPQHSDGLVNPFAGLIICKGCGGSMVYRPYAEKSSRLLCYRGCGMKSVKYSLVEEKLLTSIKWLLIFHEGLAKQLPIKSADNRAAQYNAILSRLRRELSKTECQRNELYNLLESGIYCIDTFAERMAALNHEIARLNGGINAANERISLLEHPNTDASVSSFSSIFDVYLALKTPNQKNRLLKTLIEKVEYYRPKTSEVHDFELTIHTKI